MEGGGGVLSRLAQINCQLEKTTFQYFIAN